MDSGEGKGGNSHNLQNSFHVLLHSKQWIFSRQNCFVQMDSSLNQRYFTYGQVKYLTIIRIKFEC